jgi:hypothetical protein
MSNVRLMKTHFLATAALVVIILSSACTSPPPSSSTDVMRSVTYRGETFQLPRAYVDFHDYRDDPNNLPKDEVPRIAKLVRSAPIASSSSSREEANDAIFKLMFPGYGLAMLQLRDPVSLYSIEIPMMEEDRWIALAQQGARWVVVEDFLWPVSTGRISGAKYTDGRLSYFDRKGKVLREKR